MDAFGNVQQTQPGVGTMDPGFLAFLMQSQQAAGLAGLPLAGFGGLLGQPPAGLGALPSMGQPPAGLGALPPMPHPVASLGGLQLPGLGPPLGPPPIFPVPEPQQLAVAAAPRAPQGGHRGQQVAQSPVVKAEKAQCHLHTKPKKTCKTCQRILEASATAAAEVAASATAAGVGARGPDRAHVDPARGGADPVKSISASAFGLPPLLQSHILGSAHYKESLTLETFEQLLAEMREYGDSLEPYLPNSNLTPSALFCCLFRLVTFGIDASQLLQLIELDDSPRIRCIGLLYIRFGLPPDQLWPWLGEYVLDNQEVAISTGTQEQTTVGEFAERLLLDDQYYSVVLPRLPMSVKRLLQAKLAPVPQYRRRAQANVEFLDVYRDGGISVDINVDGQWLGGTAQTVLEGNPYRVKVIVKVTGEDPELEVPLGKIIITDRRQGRSAKSGAGRAGRQRSRSRSPGKGSLTHDRGRPDQELIDELRSKDRDRATTSGKDYARRPIGFKASCAMKQEQGVASTRLMEEDTYVSDHQPKRARRSPSQDNKNKPVSAERQRHMQQLFEKYGMAKPSTETQKKEDNVPDFLRFG